MTAIEVYRQVSKQLREYKEKFFPSGLVVLVSCEQYNGYGIVAGADSSCPPDKLEVRLENGNVWWYPMECCRTEFCKQCVPLWVRRELAK